MRVSVLRAGVSRMRLSHVVTHKHFKAPDVSQDLDPCSHPVARRWGRRGWERRPAQVAHPWW
jgi:hypothetical protein